MWALRFVNLDGILLVFFFYRVRFMVQLEKITSDNTIQSKILHTLTSVYVLFVQIDESRKQTLKTHKIELSLAKSLCGISHVTHLAVTISEHLLSKSIRIGIALNFISSHHRCSLMGWRTFKVFQQMLFFPHHYRKEKEKRLYWFDLVWFKFNSKVKRSPQQPNTAKWTNEIILFLSAYQIVCIVCTVTRPIKRHWISS